MAHATEYQPPCIADRCPTPPALPRSEQSLCREMARCVIAAGGARLLETKLSPFDALMVLGPEQSGPGMAQIRGSLGIVGYYEGSQLD